MIGIKGYELCKTCTSPTYLATFEELEELTAHIDKSNLSSVIEKIGELAQECLHESHVYSTRYKIDDLIERDQFWKVLKLKAVKPNEVVKTIVENEVVEKSDFGIKRKVFTVANPSTPSLQDVFIDENRQSVLFIVKHLSTGFSIATNRIVTDNDGLYYQIVYFYSRHRDRIEQGLEDIHRSVFENIQSKVSDESIEQLYQEHYKS